MFDSSEPSRHLNVISCSVFLSGISRALLHNFAGKPSVALEGVKAGYLFSFPPAVCRSKQVRWEVSSYGKKVFANFLLSHLQKQKQTGEMRSVILWKRLYKIFCWVTWINSFNTATQRYKLIKQIPLEHICLETDSPALGLHQHVSLKGFKIIIILRHSATSADMFNLSFVYQVRNEPASIILPCRYIADVKGLPPETVRLVTAHNAYRLFPKAKTRWQWRERDFEIQGSPSVWRHGKHNSLYYCPPLSVSLRGSTWTFLNAWWITLLTFEYQKGFSLLLRVFFFFFKFHTS